MNRTTGVWKNMKFSELQNLNGGADGEVKSWFMWILNKILD